MHELVNLKDRENERENEKYWEQSRWGNQVNDWGKRNTEKNYNTKKRNKKETKKKETHRNLNTGPKRQKRHGMLRNDFVRNEKNNFHSYPGSLASGTLMAMVFPRYPVSSKSSRSAASATVSPVKENKTRCQHPSVYEFIRWAWSQSGDLGDAEKWSIYYLHQQVQLAFPRHLLWVGVETMHHGKAETKESSTVAEILIIQSAKVYLRDKKDLRCFIDVLDDGFDTDCINVTLKKNITRSDDWVCR
jgi:hypothetical protein